MSTVPCSNFMVIAGTEPLDSDSEKSGANARVQLTPGHQPQDGCVGG